MMRPLHKKSSKCWETAIKTIKINYNDLEVKMQGILLIVWQIIWKKRYPFSLQTWTLNLASSKQKVPLEPQEIGRFQKSSIQTSQSAVLKLQTWKTTRTKTKVRVFWITKWASLKRIWTELICSTMSLWARLMKIKLFCRGSRSPCLF